jgi:hypothetical protein
MSNTVQNKPAATTQQQKPKRPNEQGTISVQAHFRIFDPATHKTLVEGRA